MLYTTDCVVIVALLKANTDFECLTSQVLDIDHIALISI